MSLRAAPYNSPLQAAEQVLSHHLSTGALWEEIRMKGGAYGAFAQSDNLEGPFSFATYRDPNPLRSLDAFTSIIGNFAKKKPDKDALDKAVIGTFSRETRPRTPSEKSLSDFFRFLYGIEDKHRSRRLEDIIAVSGDQTGAVLERLARDTAPSWPVIIAGNAEAEKAASRLGAELVTLPV
jgi:Zn-dependent M16 (insulinase) family peptidase